ncbi:MAG: M56 family metallopeptidase, partial [Planctomycetota bacterium]
MVGIVLTAGRCVIVLDGARRIRSKSVELDCETLQHRLRSIAFSRRLPHVPVLRQSDSIQSPAVLPFDRTTVLVPRGFGSWSIDAQQAALAHEVSHLSHHDADVRFLVSLVASLCWFNPIVFVLFKTLILAQELSADGDAAEQVGGVHPYRRLLAMMTLQQDLHVRTSSRSCVAWTSGNPVIRRIAMLEERISSQNRMNRCALGCLFLVACICLSGWEIGAEPPEARIASLPDSQPIEGLFHKPKSELWNIPSGQFGFLVARPSGMGKIPLVNSMFQTLESLVSLSDLGLKLSRD